MPDKPRDPAKKSRSAKHARDDKVAGAADARSGRAWVRPPKAAPAKGASGDVVTGEKGASPGKRRRDARTGAAGPGKDAFRMQLGEAAEEEARAHQEEVARRRLQRLRPWVSALFLASSFSLLVYLVSIVLAVAQAPQTAIAVVIVTLVSGGLVVWALGMACTIKLREWRWLAVLGLLPVAAILAALLVPVPPTFTYPLAPVFSLVYAWGKRQDLFA
jgi:hypothetical protein